MLAVTVAGIGAFEFGAKIYYGEAHVEPIINAALAFFPDHYTLGEALKVLRHMMPLIMQAGLLMMDFSFDAASEEPDNPTALLTKICDKQQRIIFNAKLLLENSQKMGREERIERITGVYESLVDFNKNELCAGIGEALDVDDKKKEDTSIFVKIFKMLMSLSLLFGVANYILFGADGFKM